MTTPKRPLEDSTLSDAILALKRCVDDDGRLELDRAQTQYLLFFLYDIVDGGNIRFALEDLIGSLPDKQEESA